MADVPSALAQAVMPGPSATIGSTPLPGGPMPLSPGGVVTPELGAKLADMGFMVSGPIARPDAVSKTIEIKETPGQQLVNVFLAELDAAKTHRAALRDGMWQVFQANLANKVLDRSGSNSSVADRPNVYTTSKLKLPKSLEVHQRGCADLQRMMTPLNAYPFDLRIWKGRERQDDLEAQTKLETKRQFDGMDYGRVIRELVPDLMEYGIGYLDGPTLPPHQELEWTADEKGQMASSKVDTTQCWFRKLDTTSVYLDPTVKKARDAGYLFEHCPKTEWQMEQWRESMPEDLRAPFDEILGLSPHLTETQPDSMVEMNTKSDERYDVWRRVGFLTRKHFQALQTTGALKPGTEFKPGAAWDVYFERGTRKILKAEVRHARPNKLPVIIVPLIEVDGHYWPFGLQDTMAVVQDLLDHASRAMDDQLDDLASVNAVINPSRISASDYTLKGRKTWFLNENDLVPEMQGSKPFEFFTIPNHLNEILGVIKFIMGLVPELTGLPSYALQPAQQLGSGVRTVGQLTQLNEAASTWIRHVMGGMDEFCIEPMVSGVVDFIGRNQLVPLEGTVKVVPTGMQGAIRREIMLGKLIDFIAQLQQVMGPEAMDQLDRRKLPQLIAEQCGWEGEHVLLSPEDVARAQEAAAAKAQIMKQAELEAQKRAGFTPEHEERRQASVRDTLALMLKALTEKDPQNPAISFVAEQVMESCGRANDGFYAALSIWRKRDALLAEQMGDATPEELARLQAVPGPESPAELEPGAPGAPAATLNPQANPNGNLQAAPDEIANMALSTPDASPVAVPPVDSPILPGGPTA